MAKGFVFVTTSDGNEIRNAVCTGMRRAPRGMPERARICGDLWEIAYCSDLYQLRRKGKKLTKHKLYGFCISQERLIVIETECPRHEMVDTYFHEIGHAYMRKYAGASKKLLALEEEIVTVFAQAMADVAFNNRLPSETA